MKFFSILCFLITIKLIHGQESSVELSLGKVIGSTIKPDLVNYYTENGEKVQQIHQFLGVPYATPPINELRFKKPKPVNKWSPNVINADKFSSGCLQNTEFTSAESDIDFMKTSVNYSEDCLYLNIWTPKLPGDNQVDGDLKPVFVWIHGGGFSLGTANMDMYHGAVLSMSQDIVVVSINYRLGPLGFLVSPDGVSAPGNAGLWDQVMALEWIQDHIKYFGGDPNQVTIAGESAGSMSVSGLLISPMVRNLFNKVITMSGSALVSNSYIDKNIEVWKTENLAKAVNCPTDDTMMECLMKIDGHKLILNKMDTIKHFPNQEEFLGRIMIFNPITGDEMFPNKVTDLINNLGSDKKNIKVLTGVVNWEGGIFVIFENEILKKLKEENICPFEVLKEYLIKSLKIDEKDAIKIAERYLYEQKLNKDGFVAISDIVGDYFLVCPAYFENELLYGKVSSIYQYVFTFKSNKNPVINQMCPGKDTCCHALELGYLFGGSLQKLAENFHDEQDFEQAIQTMDIVGKFVRNENLTIKRGEKYVE